MDDRILVLGGAGDVGRGVVDALVSFDADPTVADVDRARLDDVATDLGVETRHVDVTDDAAVDALQEFDVVVSAVGPFYRFGERCLDLAIEAGVDFVDVCDDHDAVEAQLRHDDRAADAGVTAVVGCGWTPGISNLLASHAVEELGDATRVDVDWVGSAADSEGLAVINHVFHVLDGDVVQHLDGERRTVRAGSMDHTVDVPDVGRVSTVACGHPEPITLPEHLPVETVTLRGALIPAYQNTLVEVFNRLGLTATESRADTVARGIHAVEGLFSVGGVDRSAVRVAASDGDRDRTYAAVGPMRALTGSAAAVGALSVLEDDHPGGIHPPEAVFDPGPFLDRLVDRPIEFYRVRGDEAVTSFEG